ncbi:MAG: ribosome maturation factor RimP [Clostridiales bacterium]|jgi:ribosome maturation factor RimP|nr:ribosome maturation factor RimP [Clostridiales bacterium]
MNSKQVLELVEKNILGLLSENGLKLYDIEYVKEGPNWYLRIYIDNIDKSKVISISDCESVTRYVSKFLDEKDPIEHAYILEVSSPGIDRLLKKDSDFAEYTGSVVDIKLYKPINKQKSFTGELAGLKDGIIFIKDGEGILEFDKKNVASCRLAVVF